MAVVIRREFLQLLSDVQLKLQEHRGIEINDFDRKIDYYEQLSAEVTEATGVEIKASTFYKSYSLNLTRSDAYEVSVDEVYANALAKYAHDQNYSSRYHMSSSHARDISFYDANPEVPEYPAGNPSFPSTPIIPITLEKLNDCVIHIKDESHNELIPVHKSRAAWEIFLFAKKTILEKYRNNEKGIKFRASVLSSGNFALAVFARLLVQSIPFELNVVIDVNVLESTDERLSHRRSILNQLYEVAENFPELLRIFPFDLTKEMNSEYLLSITQNLGGVDLTFGSAINEVRNKYFDWLSMEILSASPDYLFTPFGGGDLMESIMNILVKELQKPKSRKSKRYFGNDEVLKRCNFLGLTTTDPYSPLDKLFVYDSIHPMYKFKRDKIPVYRKQGLTGEIDIFDETYFSNKRELKKLIKEAKSIFDDRRIDAEPSGLAGLVLFLKKYREEPDKFRNKKVVIINTGRGEWNFLLKESFKRMYL